MCATLAAPKKPAPPKTRGVAWVYDRETTARLIADGIPAPMVVRVGDLSWCYLVAREGKSWRLTHVRQDDSGSESYEVDLRRDGCTCPHALHRGRCVKHVPALRAALAHIGVQP